MKKLVLDTHVLLWTIGDSNKLPTRIAELITDEKNQLFVSVISLWEIALKLNIGKLKLNFQPNNIPALCQEIGIEFISIDQTDAMEFLNLPTKKEHKDPFDRMLVCQCVKKNYTLISRDSKMKIYEKDGLECIW